MKNYEMPKITLKTGVKNNPRQERKYYKPCFSL